MANLKCKNVNYFATQSGRSRDPLFADPWVKETNLPDRRSKTKH